MGIAMLPDLVKGLVPQTIKVTGQSLNELFATKNKVVYYDGVFFALGVAESQASVWQPSSSSNSGTNGYKACTMKQVSSFTQKTIYGALL